ncbi:MAG: hypothetical protein KJP00_13895, partial [Bacteroidia bacterium]|nr:hypothetical protein [Bacteroidia bacterium]
MNNKSIFFIVLSFWLIVNQGCQKFEESTTSPIYYPSNSLNYLGTPETAKERSSLAFSDMGAWFAYG